MLAGVLNPHPPKSYYLGENLLERMTPQCGDYTRRRRNTNQPS
jgi:hypothetical protein